MTRRLFTACLAVLVTGMLSAAPGALAAPDPLRFINDLGGRAIQVLGPQVPAAQRLGQFRELFRAHFDVTGIGQFVLGRYWRTANPQQQQEFLRLFQEYVVQAYSARLGEYGGQPFRTTGARPSGDATVVTSEVIRQNGSRLAIDWYLIDPGGQLKISDVYVGGVSMKVTQRDEFAAVIQRNGGRLDGLLALLREKTASAY